MGMNFGAFAGGLSNGFNQGVSMAKTIRDVIRENKLQELREKGMEEANAQREASINGMIQERGVTTQPATDAPTSGAVDTAPTTTPTASESSPTASPDSAAARTAASGMAPQQITVTPSPTANPDPAAANTAASSMPQGSQLPPSVSKQTPETTVVQPSAAQSTPQAAAANGVAGNVPGQAGFWVNGQRFNTREEARAFADKSAPSATDIFMKNAVPKIAEQYMVNGDPEKAKAWSDYADSHNGKRAIKDWAAAWTAPDFDTAATKFGKFYTDHVNDGVDYVGHKMKTNSDGTQVALITLKDKKSGKESEIELTRDKMMALGAANNPQKLFEYEQQRQLAADKAKFEATLKAQQRKADQSDKMELEGYKQDRIDARDGRNKKTTDPTERRALIRSDEMKNNPKFARLSKEEQNKIIDDAMDTIYGQGASKEGKGDSAPEPVKFADKPVKLDKSLPVYKNNETGKRYHRINGVMTPIEE